MKNGQDGQDGEDGGGANDVAMHHHFPAKNIDTCCQPACGGVGDSQEKILGEKLEFVIDKVLARLD